MTEGAIGSQEGSLIAQQIHEAGEQPIRPELLHVLSHHVVDLTPTREGNTKLLDQLGAPLIGSVQCSINRTDPPLSLDTFAIEPRKIRVLVGPNGAGKSTLYDAIMHRGADLSTEDRGAFAIGRSPRAGREFLRVARLDQEELLNSLGSMTAGEVMEQTAQFFLSQFPENEEMWTHDYDHAMANVEAQEHIQEFGQRLRHLFDMDAFQNTAVQNLSGGERTKLAIYMTLLSEPDVFIADEPTNHLDISSIAKLAEVFNIYTNAGVGVITTSHVDWFLREAGKGGVTEISRKDGARKLTSSQSSYDKYMLNPNRETQQTITGEITWGQPEYDRKAQQIVVPRAEHITLPQSPLIDVTFPQIGGADRIVISGDNGTGKTTLLDTIVNADERDPLHRGKDVRVAFLPQFWPEQVAKGTLGEFLDWIKSTASPRSQGSANNRDLSPQSAFVQKLKQLKFGGAVSISEAWLNKPLQSFSGGEQRLLWFLGVSVLRDVDMLVLDEPTNHMDRELSAKVARAIGSWPGSVAVVTHDRDLLYTMERNEKVTQGVQTLRHLVLVKDGNTSIEQSNERPAQYAQRKYNQSRNDARRMLKAV